MIINSKVIKLSHKVINFLVLGILVTFPLGQLSRLWWLGFARGIYIHDLLIASLLLLQSVQIIKVGWKSKFIVLFTIWSLLGLGVSALTLPWLQVAQGSLYLWRLLAFLFFGFWLAHYKSSFLSKRWKFYISLCIVVFVCGGWLQYFFFPNLESLFALGWDRHTYRLVGTLLDPNFTGLLLVVMIVKSLELFDYPKNLRWFFLLTVSVLLTYSRMAYLLWGVLVVYFTYFSKKKRWLMVLPFFLSGVLLLPTFKGESTNLLRTSTIEARLSNITESFNLALKVQPLGMGLNVLPFYGKDHSVEKGALVSHSNSGVDNSLLFLLITIGFFGTLWFFLVARELFSLFHPESKQIKWGIIELVIIFLAGMVIHAWMYPWIILWILFSWKERRDRIDEVRSEKN